MEENRNVEGNNIVEIAPASITISCEPVLCHSETTVASVINEQCVDDSPGIFMKESGILSEGNLLFGHELDQNSHVLTHISEQSVAKDEVNASFSPDSHSSSHNSVEWLTAASSALLPDGIGKHEASEKEIQITSADGHHSSQLWGEASGPANPSTEKEILITSPNYHHSSQVWGEASSPVVPSKDEQTAGVEEADDIPVASNSSAGHLVDGSFEATHFGRVERGPNEDKTAVSSDEPDQFAMEDDILQNKASDLDSMEQVSQDAEQDDVQRTLIDTAAPFESVRAAVSKFGGIVDWKAHRLRTVERRKYVALELEKAQQEIPQYKKQSEVAESAKDQVLTELVDMKRLIEELKISLDKARTEENQAKQDSELARLRVKELEQGIANEASVAAKAQVEVAQTRHRAAIAELKSVREELERLNGQYISLLNERDLAIKSAEDALSASKEVEKTVEGLTLELIISKESLESAHAAHLEAEEHRLSAAMAKEQVKLTWDGELKEAEEVMKNLDEQCESTRELTIKLESATQVVQELKAQLAVYMAAKLTQESETVDKENFNRQLEETNGRLADIQVSIFSAEKELEEVKASIEKAKEDVNCLKVAATSLKIELEKEKGALISLRQREGMASVAVASLQAELERTILELEMAQIKEKEAKEKMEGLPKLLQQSAEEADLAKSNAKVAQEEHRKASEEAEQAKARASTTQNKLHAALKEIEAAKASERLALAAIKALQESESAAIPDSPAGVTLSLEEYYELSKLAHEAEEQANMRVAAAMAQIEVAKESELRSLNKLDAANRELSERKEAFEIANKKAERAMEGKLGVEQEYRKWQAEHEHRQKADDIGSGAANPVTSPESSTEEEKSSKGFDIGELETTPMQALALPSQKVLVSEHSTAEGTRPDSKAKKKRSFFPRIIMFLARKKTPSK